MLKYLIRSDVVSFWSVCPVGTRFPSPSFIITKRFNSGFWWVLALWQRALFWDLPLTDIIDLTAVI